MNILSVSGIISMTGTYTSFRELDGEFIYVPFLWYEIRFTLLSVLTSK